MRLKGKNIIDKKRLYMSFKYAIDGIFTAYKGEQNLKIHTFVAIIAILMGFFFKISHVEWLILFTVIGLVIMVEFINTSLEYLVDLVTLEKNELAKKCKDTAAAGVLMMVFISIIIGLIIFIPKIMGVL